MIIILVNKEKIKNISKKKKMSSFKSTKTTTTTQGDKSPFTINTIFSIIAILMALLIMVLFFAYRTRVSSGGLAMQVVHGTAADNGNTNLVFDGNEYYIVADTVTNFTLSLAENNYVGRYFYINNTYNNHSFTFKVPSGSGVNFRTIANNAPVLTQSVTFSGLSSDPTTLPKVCMFVFVDEATIDVITVQ
jgi:hypothetical protein